MSDTQTNPLDSDIKRDRGSRLTTAVVSPLTALAVSIGASKFLLTTALNLPDWFGFATGCAAGTWLALELIERSIIVNKSVQAFVTVDPLISLRNAGNALVSYGPGMHLCHFWEQRIPENNIGLGAVAIDITGTVQTKNGTLTKKGGVRLRPNIIQLEAFLSGVGSIPSELAGLIEVEIVEFLSTQDVLDALKNIKALNEHLKHKFVQDDHGKPVKHPIEDRYGIIIDDVTIDELLPSKEIMETMGTITENETIDAIVANSFGYKNVKSLNTAVRQSKVSAEAVTRRRTEVMAMSGNLQGMELSRADYNVNLNGLGDISPEVASAVASVALAMNKKGGKKKPSKTTEGGKT